MDRTWNGEDVAPGLDRQPGRDQGPGLQGGFDHERAPRQAGDDPIANGEVLRERWRAGRVLADEQPLPGDATGELAMAPRVDLVETRGDHSDRAGRSLQRASMRRAVDTQRQ